MAFEMLTVFRADLSDLDSKAALAKTITQQTASAMTSSLNAAGTGFQTLSQGMNAIANSGAAPAMKQVAEAANQESIALKSTVASTQDLALQKASLLAQLKNVQDAIRGETKVLADAQSAVQQYGTGQKALNVALDESRQKLGGLIAAQSGLKSALSETDTALKKTQTQTQETAKSFDGLKSGIQSAGQGMFIGGAALVALGAGFAALVKSGSDLQQELVHVAGNTSMSAAEFANLQTQVVRLGLTTPIAMSEIGKSYMQAANFGFHFADANAVVEAGLKSAVATGANAEQTIRALAVAMHTFEIPAAKAAETMDLLHLAAARGGQTLEQFVGVTGKVFAVAHSMGIGLGDVTSALSALTSAGLPAAQAATLLQGAIVKIANPAAGARAEFERLGIAYGQSALAAKGLSGVLDEIREKVGNNTAEIFKLVPAMRGGIGVIILTTTALQDYKDRLQESADVMSGKLKPTQQDAERVMQTLGAQTTLLGNSFQALGFVLIQALGPSLTGAISTLNSILPEVVLTIGQLPVQILAATAAFFVAAGVVGTVSVALGGLVFILGGPVALAIVGLGVTIGALAAVVALNFGRISAIITGSTGSIKLSFVDIAGKTGAVADSFQILARVAITAFDVIVTGASLMAEGVRGAFNTIKGAGEAALALASGDLLGFAAAMKGMNDTAISVGVNVTAKIAGLGARLTGDLKDIANHANGQFAAQFGLAAMNAGQAFAKASAEQHKLVEDAGLKLVNSYLVGVKHGKEMSASLWHSMSDDARTAFTATAQAGIDAENKRLIALLGQPTDPAKQKGKALGQAVLDGFKEGTGGLSDAFALIASQSDAQLTALFDTTTKASRKGAEELKKALGAIATGIDDFFKSFGAGITVTKEQLAGFGVDFIGVLSAPTLALKQAREDQTKELIAMNEAFIAHNQDLRAILKDGTIIIEQTGLDAVEKIKASTAAEIRAYDLNEAFAQSNSDLVATVRKGIDGVSSVLVTGAHIIAQNSQDVFKEIPQSVGDRLSKDLQKGVSDAMKVTSDAFIEGWKNLKATGTVSAADVVTGITSAFNALPERFKATIKPAFDAYVAELNNIASATNAAAARIQAALASDQGFLNAQAIVADQKRIDDSIKVTIATWEEYARIQGKTGQQAIDVVIPQLKKLGSDGEKAAIQLQKSFDQVSFDALQKKVNAAVNGIVEIFTLIPGKFGDMAKEIQKVVNTIDKILGNLHKIFASIPENLGGVFATIINLFKSTATAVNGSVNSMGSAATSVGGIIASAFAGIASSVGNSSGSVASSVGSAATKGATALGNLGSAGKSSASTVSSSWGGASKSLQVGLGAAAGAFASLTTAMAVTSSTGSKTAGIVSSLFTSTLAGIQAGLAGGPIAGAIVGGISLIGGIIGAFMGKSPLQKAQDEAAMAKAKSDIVISQQAAIKAVEDVKQSMIKTASDIHDLLESIRFYTAIPKDAFAAFFKDLGKVMSNFADMAKVWLGDSDGKIKVLADDMKAVTEAIAAAPTALIAIGKYLGIPEASIERFFSDLGKLLTRFDVLTADFTKATLKHISKFADLMKPSIELFASTVGAITGMFDLKEIPAPNFDILQNALKEIVTRIGQVADFFDKAVLKSIGFFGTTVAPAVELWKNAIDAIKSMVDVPVPTTQDFSNLFGSIQSALIRMSELAGSLDTDMLLKAQSIAEASMSIFSAIKAAVESLGALRDYKAVGSETFKLLLSDFNQALQLMLDMDALSERFITLAKIFEDNIKAGADHLANAISIFTVAIRNLGFALGAFGVTLVVPGEVGTTAASGGAGTTSASSGGGFAPSFASGGSSSLFAPSAATVGGTTNHYHFGDVTISGDDPKAQRAVDALMDLFGVNTGLDARLQQG